MDGLRTKADWDSFVSTLSLALSGEDLPSVSVVARETPDPFKILISTIISLRTKDAVTLAASERLFALADTPEAVSKLNESAVAEAIYPAGFYRTKAKTIKSVSEIILGSHGGRVPASLDALLSLPGVGRKTANLTLGLGYGEPCICVDTHVHRVSNRMGIVETKDPQATEFALMAVLPKEHWIRINELLVQFGQRFCTPVSPRCSLCPFAERCPKKNVGKRR